MSLPELLGTKHVGCYADGAFGCDHIRSRLSGLLSHFRPLLDTKTVLEADALRSELSGTMSDDAGEEYDAIYLLNHHVCDGVEFELLDGDLMLLPVEPDPPDSGHREW